MMVCPYDDAHVLLILQIDHSRAAGMMAAHWGNAEFTPPKPYSSMVVAAQEHDGGWWDWEIKPTVNEEGYPIDYVGSTKKMGSSWLNFYRHGVARVAEQDSYAGLIVSMHGCGLLSKGMGLLPNMPDLSSDPDVRQFLDEQEEFRNQLLQEARRSEALREFTTDEQIWTNFKLMEVFDQMAQFVCNRYPFNSSARKNGPNHTLSNVPVPVGPGKEDVKVTVDVKDESRAVVRPYPFDVDPLEISIPARLLPRRPYTSDEDILRHFYKGERITINRTLQSK